MGSPIGAGSLSAAVNLSSHRRAGGYCRCANKIFKERHDLCFSMLNDANVPLPAPGSCVLRLPVLRMTTSAAKRLTNDEEFATEFLERRGAVMQSYRPDRQ